MLFYYSATGNTKYVAKRIAEAVGEEAVSITDCIQDNRYYFEVGEKEIVGFLTPTYAFGMPAVLSRFLKHLDLRMAGDPYVFFVTTYGSSPGQAGRFAEEELAERRIFLAAKYCVKMPDTWTPLFDVSNKQKMQKINDAAEAEIDFIIRRIRNRSGGDFMKRKMPYKFAKLMNRTWSDHMRKTRFFYTEDYCIGCGMCAAMCPDKAIEMRDHKPVWVRDTCIMCLGCLHRCPIFAIQYLGLTGGHGQYLNPHMK